LGDYFGVMLGGDDVGRGKPAPDLFLRAAEMLAVEAGRCVVLEDSVHGIEAAHAAGMACLALTGTRSAADLAGAERVVDSLVSVSVGDMAALL
jgi:beta-phosphoglucomutase-like phosphatase (HAD superfamily)